MAKNATRLSIQSNTFCQAVKNHCKNKKNIKTL